MAGAPGVGGGDGEIVATRWLAGAPGVGGGDDGGGGSATKNRTNCRRCGSKSNLDQSSKHVIESG